MEGTQRASKRVAFVTGPASGLGLAVCDSLHERGWIVSGVDWSQTHISTSTATRPWLDIHYGDVRKYDELATAFAKTWRKYGRLDHVSANAGMVQRGSFYEEQKESANSREGLPMPPYPSDAITALDVNLTGQILTAYLALHYMRKSYIEGNKENMGTLVFTASLASLQLSISAPVYGAAKMGVAGFSRCIANPYKRRGIRVNCICPGFSRTNLVDSAFYDIFPAEHLMPVPLFVQHVHNLMEDEDAVGKVLEISGQEHFFHDMSLPSNEAARRMCEVVSTDVF